MKKFNSKSDPILVQYFYSSNLKVKKVVAFSGVVKRLNEY